MALESLDDLLLRSDNDAVWELFHENSKTSLVEPHPTYRLWPSEGAIVGMMRRLRRVKPYRDFPKIALPREWPASRLGFDEVVAGRRTARGFGAGSVALEQLAKVLALSYGVNRDNAGTPFTRPFRTVPSGGALYPLEIYLAAARIEGLQPGLYHYDPEDHALDALRPGEDPAQIAALLVQRDLALGAAAIVLITAVFFRSTFKYGDRGYRFVLLEAGHLAQNANLVAQEMGLATTNVGGFADRAVDRHLGLDGLNESTLYVLLLGPAGEQEPVSNDWI